MKNDIANKDERILYISEKAKSWTLSLTVFTLIAIGVILYLANLGSYGNICFYTVCGISLMYSVMYFIFSRRY